MPEKPRRLECEEAVEHLYTYLDQELTPELEAAIRAHLQECTGCFGHFEFEKTFLRFLESRSRAQSAPEPLRRRVFEQILFQSKREPE
ncbi:MAG: mycothiol system anti-sigma-R factor [Gemmatimonadetes bacterium]|nr:mycothiol system anti-sigma-R factor [Gemmatimonadota bacterium]